MNYVMAPGLPKKYRKRIAITSNGIALKPNVDKIVSVVADYYNVSPDELKSKSRERKLSFPRHICIWIALMELPIGLMDIALFFGRTDHTTASHSRDVINDFISTSSDLKEEIESVYAKVKAAKNGKE